MNELLKNNDVVLELALYIKSVIGLAAETTVRAAFIEKFTNQVQEVNRAVV